MPVKELVEKLVTRLTELSHEGKVKWTETGDRDTFLAFISNYNVTIGKIGSLPHKEFFQFRVFDNIGRIIEESTVSVPEIATGTGEAETKLAELHSLARGQAVGVNKALSDLLVSLEQIR